MIDMEKVITYLDDMRLFADTRVHQIVSPKNWEIYSDLCDFIDLIKKEILILLEEQEPKTVLLRDDGDYCPRCSTITTRTMGVQKLHRGTKYCPYCGQKVKWDENHKTWETAQIRL